LAGHYGEVVRLHPHALEQAEMALAPELDPTMHGALSGRDVDTDSMAMMMSLISKLTVPLPPARLLEDGDRIGEWEGLLTPGHAPGHLCLYRERDGVLLAGDLLLPDTTPNLHLTHTMRDAVSDFVASLERVAALEISLVLPSHGEPFTDAAGRAAQLIAHHERRLQRLIHELAAGPRAEAELSTAIFGHLKISDQIMMAQMETHAHLEHLRLKGRVGFQEPDIWSLASSRLSPSAAGS
jgi:glyoxylase-like metal-dependent hydrolase (beta-lactamase superfamily II)